MPDSVKFSELPSASDIGGGDLAALAAEDQQAETGYTSKKATIQQLGGFLNNALEYTTALQTSEKKIIPAINELRDLIISQIPTKSASGSLVNFTTQLALPLVSLKTNIVASGGGGTPSTPIPIVGVSEVNIKRTDILNILDGASNSVSSNGITMTYLGGGKYRVTGDMSANQPTSLIMQCSEFSIYGGSDSTIAFNNSFAQASLNLTLYNGNTSVEQWVLNTVNRVSTYSGMRDKTVNRFILNIPSALFGTHLDFTFQVMMYGSDRIDTFTLPLGQTVYGGYVDWELGKLVVNFGFAELNGSENWGNQGNDSFYTFISGTKSGIRQDGLCNFLTKVNNIGSEFGFVMGYNNSAFYASAIIGTIDGVTDLASWKTYLSNNHLQVVYPLATPIEISLPTTMPQTIQGVQNWFADSGDIELEYKMGVQEYIDKKIAEVQALVL